MLLSKENKSNITTFLTTYIELMLLCKKFGLDPVRVSLSVMEIARTFDMLCTLLQFLSEIMLNLLSINL